MTPTSALRAEDLRARIPEEELPASTSDIAPLEQVTGQDRALEAVAFGLGIEAEGYNIAVSGLPSSGRTTAVRLLVEQAAAKKPPAPDWCYLYNFNDPYRPRALSLPPGLGDDLQRDLVRLVEACRTEIPKAFDSESYGERSTQVLEPFNNERQRVLEDLQRASARLGYAVNVTPMGFMAVPVNQEGRPLTPEIIAGLPEEFRATLETRGKAVEESVTAAMRELRRIDGQAHDAIIALDRDVTRFVVGGILEDLREKYVQYGLGDYFEAIEKDIIANLEQYRRFNEGQMEKLPAHIASELVEAREQLLKRYTVNLFVAHGDTPATQAPVVFERHPTYYNLFGRLDYVARYGSMTTDFTQIRPGAVQVANGGYLVLQLEDLLTAGPAWVQLKRALKTREVRVEDIGESMMAFPTVTLVAEPIPLSMKVVLVGTPLIVSLLDALDPDFHELFKIRAEFEPDTDCNPASIRSYAGFIRKVVDTCSLKPFSREAIAEVVHYGNRLAGRKDRLTTRYGAIADLCQETGQVAARDGHDVCTAQHVLTAIAGMRRRSGLIPDRIRRMITEGTLHVETSGSVVGQVNGLAVYQIGSQAFGTPTRITCRTGLGRRGVVAIEREVERSGAIHSKGVLVLAGYLMGTFGRTRPLAFTASLTFEQSYDEVEGDSASSAELYAILTSLAGVPIRQDVAVTGSVDQFGRIQPVGGVMEKVEGFFDVCKAIGFTGTQGVVIPSTNLVNLTLRPDVVEEVSNGNFHLWAVSTVEEGLEVLTGVPAGKPQPDGTYPEGTLFQRVAGVLDEMKHLAGAPGELNHSPGAVLPDSAGAAVRAREEASRTQGQAREGL